MNNIEIPEISVPPHKFELEENELLQYYYNWNLKRKYYPGWIYLPIDNRKSLWLETRFAQDKIFHNIPKLSKPYDLLLLYELIWRLDKCCVPFSTSNMEVITKVINQYNPFPDDLDIPEAQIKINNSNYINFDWNFISEAWVEILVTLISDARRDINEEQFNYWISFLDKVKKNNAEWTMIYYYEKCLFYLSTFRKDMVLDTLNQWPVNNDLCIYEAKKASVYAELGEIDIAEKYAETALNNIRKQYQPYDYNYNLMSQEGWIILLLQSIRDNTFGYNSSAMQELNDRYESLRPYRCDPWNEIRPLRLTLEGPEPEYRVGIKIQKSFDLDSETISRSMQRGYNFDDFIPAYAFLMIYEKTSIPMSCGMVRMFDDSIYNASNWLKNIMPYLSLTSFIRAGDDKKLDEYLSRMRIATFDTDQLNRIYTTFYNSLDVCIKNLPFSKEKINFKKDSFTYKTIVFLSEILSRLTIRLSQNQIDDLLKLTIELYKHPLLRNDYTLHKPVKVMVKRVLFAMTFDNLIKHLDTMLSLPIANEDGFKTDQSNFWPEPFSYIEPNEDKNLPKDFDFDQISDNIERLIKLATNKDIDVRTNAILRLSKLNRFGILTETHLKEFTQSVWSQYDETTNLPANTNLLSNFLITLPGLDQLKIDALKKAYLENEFKRVLGRHDNNGKISKSMQGSAGHYVFYNLLNLINLSKPLFIVHKVHAHHFIDWSNAEAVILLKNLIKWWDEEKLDIRDETVEYDEFSGNLRQAFSIVDRLLSRVIIIRLKEVDPVTLNELKRLITEMTDKKFYMLSSNVALSVINQQTPRIEEKILEGLNSIDEDYITNALDACWLKLTYEIKGEIPKSDYDFKSDIINRFMMRRQPRLIDVVDFLSRIFKYHSQILKTTDINNIVRGIEYFDNDLSYANFSTLTYNNKKSFIEKDELPNYREAISELIHLLYIYFEKNTIEIPTVIKNWKENASKDPLPEVRAFWE